MFVLDCSVAAAWLFEDEASEATDALLRRLRQDGAVVPGLWHWEVANVLTMAHKRGRISVAKLPAITHLITHLPIETDQVSQRRTLRETLALAHTHGLTAYDGAYLELALRRAIPLATLDKALGKAASNLGLSVWP